MDKRHKYKWQGEPVKVRFGYCKVKENKEKPLYWYNYECSDSPKGFAFVAAIEVTYGNEVFRIANHYGIGAYKLKKGGWPNCRHFSISTEFEFVESHEKWCNLREFNEREFAAHEAARDRWQKKNYPKEYEAVESLKAYMKQNKLS